MNMISDNKLRTIKQDIEIWSSRKRRRELAAITRFLMCQNLSNVE